MKSSIPFSTITVNGLSIRVYQAGETGENLILLHGGGVDSALISWEDYISELSQHYRVYAPDLPGYGDSAIPNRIFDQDFYLNFLDQFMVTLNIERAHLAGLSLGGGISLGFALTHPEKVGKLILVDSYGIISNYGWYHPLMYLYIHSPLNEFSLWLMKKNPQWIRQSLNAIIFDPQNITPDLAERTVQATLMPEAGRAFRTYQRSEYRWRGVKSDYVPRLKALKIPTLILHGDQDITIPVQWAQKAHSLIPNSRLVILKNRKHWALRDNPQEIIQIIEDFLSNK